ncbi:S-methyl-5-thioribose kinase [Calditerricola satsumensis]|uniref:Methylthioribose kinase n=1 Tax=Calditerricola satsumensis TaxID=373054 RepID=A0A8J3BI83_9BACI|nr:S-methyl-5-thioribose kinase [Calditerricola satsumensis]GGK05606.1 methylthioribose kinase [Calditerricola satsumensis]
MSTTYRPLTETDAVAYVKERGFFPRDAALTCREIGDGNLNLVFHLVDPKSGQSLILKQALPYARVVGESWPLTLDRARIEAEALRIEGELAPGLVPKVIHYDADLALTVMEDLSDHIVMRKGLMARTVYPRFAEHMATFLARTLFFTSDLYLSPEEKKAKQRAFINPEMCKITEDLVFSHPYYNADTNHFNPLIRDAVEALWQNGALKREVARLKEAFMTKAQALIHGDLHTGSIMVKADSTKVIDPEFAFYGPMGFDPGAVFANLLLSYASHEGHTPNEAERRDFQAWLLETIEAIWRGFAEQFAELWAEHVKDEMWNAPGYREAYLRAVLQDAVGFAGCKMMRRVIGLAHVADLETIPDPAVRATCEKLALAIGQALVLRRETVQRIEDLTALVRDVAAERVSR